MGNLERHRLFSNSFDRRSLHYMVFECPKNRNRTNGHLPEPCSVDRGRYRLADSRGTTSQQTTSWWRNDFLRNLSYKIFQVSVGESLTTTYAQWQLCEIEIRIRQC